MGDLWKKMFDFYVVGEDIEGNIIEGNFNGDINSCVLDCKKILVRVGGGHLDIFVMNEDGDEFVGDVEV